MNSFHLLPIELLSHIFIISNLSSNRVHHIGVNNWRLVCHRWNEAVVNIAQFWTDISLPESLQLKLQDPSEREEYDGRIQRAGSLPLRVFIGRVLPKYFDSLQVIYPYLGQTISLEIWQEPDLQRLALWDGTLQSATPRERNTSQRRGLFPFHLQRLFELLQKPMPMLEELTLQLRLLALATITFDVPALRSLRSHCQYVTIDTKQTVAFKTITLEYDLISEVVPARGGLMSFPRHLFQHSLASLETLTLSWPHTNRLDYPPISEMHFTALKTLVIHRQSSQIIPIISSSVLQTLVVYLWSSNPSPPSVGDVSKYGRLESFIIDGTFCHAKGLQHWNPIPSLRTCSPTLTELKIRGPIKDLELPRALHNDASLLPNLEELDVPFPVLPSDGRLLLMRRPRLHLYVKEERWELSASASASASASES